MTFGDLAITEAENAERVTLAPLTDAQRRTVDALALYVAAGDRAPVDVAVVPSTFERGAVLVLVTPDCGPAPDYVTAVYAADGTRHAVYAEGDYARALAAAGGVHLPRVNATRRESTSAYVVREGGAFLTEAEGERWQVGR